MKLGLKAKQNSPLKSWLSALEMTAPIADHPTSTLPVLIGALADKFGAAPALISEHQTLSYRDLADQANRYAAWAVRQQLAFGDVVCLLMDNSPEYFAIWLGITKVGGIVSLLNTHIVGDSLAYCINIVAPKHIIAGAEFAHRLAPIEHQLSPSLKLWIYGENDQGLCRIDNETEQYSGGQLAVSEFRPPSISDRALYIYTSGTTGLPKAASISHFRLMQWSHWFAGMIGTRADDRMYNCLPMYHSVGGVVAIGAMLVKGGSVMLRQKFSARRFWDDIVQWHCTIFQYIGELCRYLVSSPPHPRELDHSLRICCGNGLTSGVWDKFKQRFHIPRILEFYAATEGTFSLYNCEGKPGAIGRVPAYLAHRFPIALVQFDNDNGAPKRNENGFCARCAAGEIGEAIGKIAANGSNLAEHFEGYSDRIASEQKLLRNVFVNGDVWFRTGDLMRQDNQGYFYFVDRIGDTFSWKGENVSATELADLICKAPGVIQSAVYGVSIPGTEGRAGMATVVVNDGFDIASFHRYLAENLPDYARPVFLRLADYLPITGTYKSQKYKLSCAGYDPSATTDP
ncbi:MAG: long-chain-acyl-CoA synthetase, partial [Deltaproteobacteria bacterium]|nr:long-chain-acyl-CoA synthetase [Deltaproteobacteria bacterium]